MGANGRLRPSSFSGATLALALLLAINLFNYIDRNVLASLVPSIRASMAAHGENISSQQMGYLAPAFLISYMVGAPTFLRELAQHTGGLRSGQSLFASAPIGRSHAYGLWWPWGDGMTTSLRIGLGGADASQEALQGLRDAFGVEL